MDRNQGTAASPSLALPGPPQAGWNGCDKEITCPALSSHTTEDFFPSFCFHSKLKTARLAESTLAKTLAMI